VSEPFVEPLEQPEGAGGRAFVGDRQGRPIVIRLLDYLSEQFGSLVWRLVEANACEDDRRPRTLHTCWQRCDRLSELCFGPPRVARLEMGGGRGHSSSQRVVGSIGGCHFARPLERERGRPEGAPAARMPRCKLECLRDRFVGRLDGGGQMPSSRLGIVEQLGEPCVDLGATPGICDLVGARCEKRMRKTDSAGFDLDDPRRERRAQALLTIDPRHHLGEGDRGLCLRGRREQIVAAYRRQSEQPAVNEVVKRRGDGQRLSRVDGDATALEHANDLEGIERIAVGGLPHLLETRFRQDDAEV
jgi:hypothetical protein